MQRLQAGDADACRDLLDDIGPAVTGFLRRRMAASDEIEDVYQEVFMAVFEARHTYEAGRPLEPWLFAIARNVAADHARRHWARAGWQELVAEAPDRPEQGPVGPVVPPSYGSAEHGHRSRPTPRAGRPDRRRYRCR